MPLADTLAALRAAPPAVDLGAEERALAAFRALRAAGVPGGPAVGALTGPAGPNVPDSLGHTLELEVPHGRAVGRRRGRARHRGRPAAETRPATGGGGRSGPGRPSAGKRLALAIATTAAAVVIVGVFAYAGRLPEPFLSVAHSIGVPSAHRPATASSLPSSPAPNRGLTGSGTRASQSSTSAPSSASVAGGPGAAAPECLAYFKKPWLPDARSWDKADWAKLAGAVHPPANVRAVWQYCHTALRDSSGHLKPGVVAMPIHGGWPTPPEGNPGQDGNSQGGSGGSGQSGGGNAGTGAGNPASGGSGANGTSNAGGVSPRTNGKAP